uniref:Mating-type protein MAT-1 n=1 Tax=Cochliobolus cymbopogonis TaxID=90976 RepID=MAT1_COCCY|nr:RecName: Full=Mating-type protein MAT-1 [Curvularia cymbopogonis]AAD33445.1 mating type protein MAT-1 [Curvularia cymbopogonis]
MASAREPTEDEIAKFLATRTSSQILQLMRCIREPAAQFAFTAKLLTFNSVKSAKPTVPPKAKKALNAFVGFRCYYIAIPAFKQWPMKKLSNLISLLWDRDPNKSLWSLMAKAWSNIRDQVGKDQAPLDEFFDIICSHLKLPDPASYLDLHGWILIVNDQGDPTLVESIDSKSASVGSSHIDLALSVEDIIAFVRNAGYAPTYIPNDNITSPTFLGQLANSPALEEDQAVAEEYDTPMADTSSASEFQQSLQREMAITEAAASVVGPDPLPDFDFTPFYESVNNLIVEHMAMEQANAGYTQGTQLSNHLVVDSGKAYLGMNDFVVDLPELIDYDAFHFGGNEDVTLPMFDDITYY